MELKIIKSNELKKKPEGTLGFGKYFSDHMFVMDYQDGKWQNARIEKYGPLLMDPSMCTFHYAQETFEGLKAYKAVDGRTLLFRPNKNFARLNKSNERLCIPTFDEDFVLYALKELVKIDRDWIPTEPNTSLYIRPFCIATDETVGAHTSHNYKFIIILSPVGTYYKEGLNPVKIMVETNYVRAVKGGVGFAKTGGNYASSLRAQEDAAAKGYSQVLWLDGVERKYVEEVGTMNVMFKINGEVITPSLEGSILAGVTRDSIIHVLKDMGVKVTERKISIDEVYEAYLNGTLEEAFGTGTAAVISPIGVLGWKDKVMTINNGETGPLSKKLYETLTGIQKGEIEDKFNWTVDVDK